MADQAEAKPQQVDQEAATKQTEEQQQQQQQQKRGEEQEQHAEGPGTEEDQEADLAYDEGEEEEGQETKQSTAEAGGDDALDDDDAETKMLQQQVLQEEASLQQDREALNQVLKNGSQESREDSDKRSVFVQNVDYSTSEVDLQLFFKDCGPVRRITIGRTPAGQPKGFAYVEFTDEKAVDTAKGLSNQMLKGRQVTVMNKRTNIPGLRKRGRGRGHRGRGRGRGGFRGRRGRRARAYAVYFSTS